jgi:hypothetical protein
MSTQEPAPIAEPLDTKHVVPGTNTVDVKTAAYSGLEKPESSTTSGSQDATSEEDIGVYDQKNPFADLTVAEHWRQIYEASTYECRHVFDPTATWSQEEERKLIRKLDWRVCLWAVGVDKASRENSICEVDADVASASCSLPCKSTEPILGKLCQTIFLKT